MDESPAFPANSHSTLFHFFSFIYFFELLLQFGIIFFHFDFFFILTRSNFQFLTTHFLFQSTAQLAKESLKMFDALLAKLDSRLQYLKHPAFIPSFHEVSVPCSTPS